MDSGTRSRRSLGRNDGGEAAIGGTRVWNRDNPGVAIGPRAH
jgi:hypothetical protein